MKIMMIPSVTMSESASSTSSDDEKTKQEQVRQTHTHLTYSRHHLVDVAHETIQISENGFYVNRHGKTVNVKQDLDASVEGSVHYEHEFDFVKALAVHDAAAAAASGYCVGANNDASQQYLPNKRQFTLKTSSSRNVLAPSTPERQQQSSSSLLSSSKVGGDQFTLNRPSPRPSSSSSSSSPKNNSTPPTTPQFPKTSFLVVSANWLESALELIDAHRRISSSPLNNSNNIQRGDGHHYYRVGVLNSGSGTTPGGKFLQGAVSQEDCLCRASLLYSCISQPKFQSYNRFYGMNRTLHYGTSNCVIFSPDVPVIRDDSSVSGNLLDAYEKVSFVTLPAPNAFTTSSRSGKEYKCDVENSTTTTTTIDGMISRNTSIIDLSSMGNENLEHTLYEEKRKALLYSLTDRISRALSAFVLGGCTDLILPAFGCGVHGNDPDHGSVCIS
jgi:hypothetical protein